MPLNPAHNTIGKQTGIGVNLPAGLGSLSLYNVAGGTGTADNLGKP